MKHWKPVATVVITAALGGYHAGCRSFETFHLFDFLLHVDQSSTLGVAIKGLMTPGGVAAMLFLIIALVGVVVRLVRKQVQPPEKKDLPAPREISSVARPRVKTKTVIEERSVVVTERIKKTVIDSDSDDEAVNS
jgi:ABC-type antimicrobial peptide transport system permease subunit